MSVVVKNDTSLLDIETQIDTVMIKVIVKSLILLVEAVLIQNNNQVKVMYYYYNFKYLNIFEHIKMGYDSGPNRTLDEGLIHASL